MKLLIVESPTKAKTIEHYLKGFVVKATMGHIKDLPKTKMGVDIDNGFCPHYIIIKGKRKIVKELKEAAGKASAIYIATDPDREGEAIAYHVRDIIGKDASRVMFYEMTKSGIEEGMKNPGNIDLNRVESQKTRRILDRLVGYKVSPILWKTIKRGLSAGRVQSVVLRLICEREEEIEKFTPEKYYVITGNFSDSGQFTAKLIKIAGKKQRIKNIENAKNIVEEIKKSHFFVEDVVKKVKKQFPFPPLITSSLQREMARRFNFSAKKTMLIAQQLFEGIELQEGRTGLITYMRTDSPRLSERAVNEIRKWIKEKLGKEYLPEKPNIFKGKKTAQEAHEAIRPTSVMRDPETIKGFLTSEQYKLYKVVFERAIASQAKSAIWDETTVEIGDGKYTFVAVSQMLKFPGFLNILGMPKEGKGLPPLKKGEKLKLVDVDMEEKETKPPSRYTEGTMVKKMEDEGIGRPSTYATIISTLLQRNYVRKKEGFLIPEHLGRVVNNLLVTYFPDIFNVRFTEKMESELDEIEEGKRDRVEVLKELYVPLETKLKSVENSIEDIKSQNQIMTDIKCDICGRPMVIKWGRYGRFLACSGWPECKYTRPLPEDIEVIDRKCPKCGANLVVKYGKYGRFIACSRYPECDYTSPYTIGVKCPEGCDGEFVERKSKKGKIYYTCEDKNCNIVHWYKPVSIECPKCGNHYMLERHRGKKIYYECPKCKNKINK